MLAYEKDVFRVFDRVTNAVFLQESRFVKKPHATEQ